jgi:serine/threonine protein kinase
MSDRLLAGRYLLGPQLGEGAVGVVYAAEDQVAGAAVALKRALSPGQRLRREEVALQRAALPGVVRLLDDGV